MIVTEPRTEQSHVLNQLSHVLYFDIKSHFLVTSSAFIACLFDLVVLFGESRALSYAL